MSPKGGQVSPFLAGVTWLLVFQFAGEAVVRLAGVPLPGPVVGMALLFAALVVRGRVPEALGTAADGLAKHLSLLFVPAGVGVMAHLGRLTDEWLPVSVSLVLSTLATIAVTAVVMRALLARRQPGQRP